MPLSQPLDRLAAMDTKIAVVLLLTSNRRSCDVHPLPCAREPFSLEGD